MLGCFLLPNSSSFLNYWNNQFYAVGGYSRKRSNSYDGHALEFVKSRHSWDTTLGIVKKTRRCLRAWKVRSSKNACGWVCGVMCGNNYEKYGDLKMIVKSHGRVFFFFFPFWFSSRLMDSTKHNSRNSVNNFIYFKC